MATTERPAILSFHIQCWKAERDGDQLGLSGADDAFAHPGVSKTIEKVLKKHGLEVKDIISITSGVAPNRDLGSWDFWLFCRNPYNPLDAY